MKTLFRLWPIIIGLIVVGSSFVWWYWQEGSVKNGSPTDLLVINVLSKELYDDAHIKGSIQIDFDEVANFAQGLDRSTPIVVYCSNHLCTASDEAVKTLRGLGFSQVSVYAAGMARWFQNGLPTKGPAKLSYLRAMAEEPTQSREPEIPLITTQELANRLGVVASKDR